MTSPARDYELCGNPMSECGLRGQPVCSLGERCGAPLVDVELDVDFSNPNMGNMALATEAELAVGKPADYLSRPFGDGWDVLGDPTFRPNKPSPGKKQDEGRP